jgi:hypothetical protein
MNLHEITTQGSGVSLGPVTVTKAFNKFAGATCVLVLVTDGSVQAPVAVKVWGPASNTLFQEGMVMTFQGSGPKGKLEYKEYKGKWEINANDCNVLVGGAPAQQQAPQGAPASSGGGYQPRGAQAPPAGGNEGAQTLAYDEMVQRMESYAKKQALFTRILVDELTVNHGFPIDQALILAGGGSAGLYAQSWFLQKGY